MNRLFSFVTLVFIVVLLAFPFAVFAQDGAVPTTELPAWALGLPTILGSLVGFNFKTTEWFKRILSSKQMGWTPNKDLQGVLVLLFSVGLGIGSAWIVPHATDWLSALNNPFYAVLLTGFSVSTVGGIVYEVMGRLNTSAVYTTSTTINTPKDSTSTESAEATMKAVSQAVKS